MKNLDINIKQQKDRLKYIKDNIDLDNCNEWELEIITNYVLNGEDEDKKYLTEERLDKKMAREKHKGLKKDSNIVDDYEQRTENDKSIYKTKKQKINKDDLNIAEIKEYYDLYDNITKLIKKNGKNKDYFFLCKQKSLLMDDMILCKDAIKGTFGYSVETYMGQHNNNVGDFDLSNGEVIIYLLKNYIYFCDNLTPDNPRYLDFLDFKEKLNEIYFNELDEKEKNIVAGLIIGLSDKEIMNRNHYSKKTFYKKKKKIKKKF